MLDYLVNAGAGRGADVVAGEAEDGPAALGEVGVFAGVLSLDVGQRMPVDAVGFYDQFVGGEGEVDDPTFQGILELILNITFIKFIYKGLLNRRRAMKVNSSFVIRGSARPRTKSPSCSRHLTGEFIEDFATVKASTFNSILAAIRMSPVNIYTGVATKLATCLQFGKCGFKGLPATLAGDSGARYKLGSNRYRLWFVVLRATAIATKLTKPLVMFGFGNSYRFTTIQARLGYTRDAWSIKACFGTIKRAVVPLLTRWSMEGFITGFANIELWWTKAFFGAISLVFMYTGKLLTTSLTNFGIRHNKIPPTKDARHSILGGADPLSVPGFSERFMMPSLSLSNYSIDC